MLNFLLIASLSPQGLADNVWSARTFSEKELSVIHAPNPPNMEALTLIPSRIGGPGERSTGIAFSGKHLSQAENNSIDSVKNSLTRLSPIVVRLRMQTLPDWTTDGESLFYTGTFTDFVEAIDFVNSLVAPAEDLGHHPDITINYNRVSIELTTHDAGGLTELDFQLATKISQL